ncbi:MAG: CHAT domain-containing protein [Flavobacteriales bacterium]|nr:CHAT domain-containing protein [Flavobacteriales bacterium]
MAIRITDTQRWSLTDPPAPKARRGRRNATFPELPEDFLSSGVTIGDVKQVQLKQGARRGPVPRALDLEVDELAGGGVVLAVRHPSGALTFHAPLERTVRGRKRGSSVRFRVNLPEQVEARRGPLASALKLIVLKVARKVLEELTPKLVRLAGRKLEEHTFRSKGLAEGLFRVELGPGELKLGPVRASDVGDGRSLLLLHGTFSNAQAAFRGLLDAPAEVVRSLKATYGDRIYAFDHFTLSRSPQENAAALLAALPARTTTFDVITHSRGGLVLRYLCELGAELGQASGRFQLGKAVLVAAPNQGTPLATPERWEATVGAMANLLEAFPDNPFTTGAAFVANGIVWLARHVTVDLPGLASMNEQGEVIAALQGAQTPGSGSYWSIGANYHPDQRLWQRLIDAGVDGFFQGANDLVVPAEGSWRVDGSGVVIPAERIGCFGPGGNLVSNGTNVHHLNLFGQAATGSFLLHALGIRPMSLPTLDPGTVLPTRRILRGGKARSTARPERTPHAPAPPLTMDTPASTLAHIGNENTLQLTILGGWRQGSSSGSFKAGKLQEDNGMGKGDPAPPVIMATYGAARVVEPFPTTNLQVPGAGTRYSQIISQHEAIRMSLESVPSKRNGRIPELPDEAGLRTFGEHLFRALFVGDVRHLYDVARSQQRNAPLNIVFTCMVPWLASFPWEFCFDPVRRKFLATEEVHFIRNVLTAVPPQVIPLDSRPLRLLVIGSQPEGSVPLSLGEEEERLRNAFKSLIATGLVEMDVLVDITPKRLHDHIQAAGRSGRNYDVVHFMGHAGFDEHAQEGRLLFMSSDGGEQEVDIRTLREILCDRGIHLVFLNACDTARSEDKGMERNKGVAQALVDGGLPAVVANQYPVLDSSAVDFAERFYWSLAIGGTLGEAAREARIAVNYSIEGDTIDWAVPVLYARDPGFRLRQLLPGAPVQPPLDPERTARINALNRSRRNNRQRLRIGIADIAHYFPGLPEILERINSVQDEILVEPVSVTVPLGVWELKREDGEVLKYLHAEKFSGKLLRKTRSLGVDLLQCITHHPLCDSVYTNIYGWWSSDPANTIMLFSTAGLALPNHGPGAGRVIVNGLIENLAAQLAESNRPGHYVIHDRGPKDCPFYYNEQRDTEVVSGMHTFDARCRGVLLKQLPAPYANERFLAAMEAILSAFGAEEAPPRSPGRRQRLRKR